MLAQLCGARIKVTTFTRKMFILFFPFQPGSDYADNLVPGSKQLTLTLGKNKK